MNNKKNTCKDIVQILTGILGGIIFGLIAYFYIFPQVEKYYQNTRKEKALKEESKIIISKDSVRKLVEEFSLKMYSFDSTLNNVKEIAHYFHPSGSRDFYNLKDAKYQEAKIFNHQVKFINVKVNKISLDSHYYSGKVEVSRDITLNDGQITSEKNYFRFEMANYNNDRVLLKSVYFINPRFN